jgi:type VI secretion system secreted protein VgrG
MIFGDVGVSPGSAIAILPDGQPIGGEVHAGDPVALQAQTDLTAAYNNLAGRPCLPANNRTDVDLGGKTLAPGVYCFDSSAGITGDLVLDAQGNPNAEWVFQVGTTLTTATDSTVSVIGGSGCNVYWQIGSSATLGTRTKLIGNIVAHDSITLVNGSTVLVGRTLARLASVNLDGSIVSATVCQ